MFSRIKNPFFFRLVIIILYINKTVTTGRLLNNNFIIFIRLAVIACITIRIYITTIVKNSTAI